jgi:FdhD protein
MRVESLPLTIGPSLPFPGALLTVDPAVHPVNVVRVDLQTGAVAHDVAATEEPLEIRLGSRPFVMIMRTPGQDRHLAAGFLLSEQIVRTPGDIAAMRYCTDDEGRDTVNVLNVWLNGDAAVRAQVALRGRRHVTANSACGVCGRRSIGDLLEGARRIKAALTVSSASIAGLPTALRAAQLTFDQTGGLHAAGLFTSTGVLVRAAEDVGRHNAVDKVIGGELFAGLVPLSDRILFVSGRISFEIIQKAVVAGIPVVASVSAPSSLAIELAREANVTLLGFVRGTTFNIYSGAERIDLCRPADLIATPSAGAGA